jgi:HAD superfamily hydrolase (TIGR01509 family)
MHALFDGIDTVLFDVDGVLVDSRESNYAFFRALVKKAGYGSISENDMDRIHYLPLRKSLKIYLEVDDKEIDRIIDMATDKDIQQHHLLQYPSDLRSTLEDLNCIYTLGLVTSRMSRAIEEVLQPSGISDLFDVKIGLEDAELPKPHPAPLLVALNRLQSSADRAVYIGDSLTDIDAAHAAGMRSILLSSASHDDATTRIDQFVDLRQMLL